MTTKPRGGVVKALVIGPLKKELFFADSLGRFKTAALFSLRPGFAFE